MDRLSKEEQADGSCTWLTAMPPIGWPGNYYTGHINEGYTIETLLRERGMG